MISTVEIGWIVLFNDYSGISCPAIVTKVYSPGLLTSDLDIHIIGAGNNASFTRGKIQVPYGIGIIGSWEYNNSRQIFINQNDLPLEGDSLIYDANSDTFITESIQSILQSIDGGVF